MNALDTLEPLAGFLPNLPDEALESLLLTFDAVLNHSGADGAAAATRPAVAMLVRKAASVSEDPVRMIRLIQAAVAIDEGRPCAFSKDGLDARQAAEAAAAAATGPTPLVIAEDPKFVSDESSEDVVQDDDDDEEDASSSWMEDAPPPMPHLAARHFFGGLVVRVARDFADLNGRPACEGEVLRVIRYDAPPDRSSEDHVLSALEGTLRLNARAAAGHAEILENAGNSWLQPVPDCACLLALGDTIEARLNDAEDVHDDLDDDTAERLDDIRYDLESCRQWLAGDQSGAPPELTGDVVATSRAQFGAGDAMVAWLELLVAGVRELGSANRKVS